MVLYGLARRHARGETLTAAVLLGIFVIAIARIGKRVDARLKRKAGRKKGKHGTARHSASNRPGPAT